MSVSLEMGWEFSHVLSGACAFGGSQTIMPVQHSSAAAAVNQNTEQRWLCKYSYRSAKFLDSTANARCLRERAVAEIDVTPRTHVALPHALQKDGTHIAALLNATARMVSNASKEMKQRVEVVEGGAEAMEAELATLSATSE